MAFREAADSGNENRPIVREILARIGAVLSEKDPLDHINISGRERAALKKIACSLRYSRL
jgi:hypothetical protein